jgi:hypothetical protein
MSNFKFNDFLRQKRICSLSVELNAIDTPDAVRLDADERVMR